MGILYGCAGRLTALFGGFRPGQMAQAVRPRLMLLAFAKVDRATTDKVSPLPTIIICCC